MVYFGCNCICNGLDEFLVNYLRSTVKEVDDQKINGSGTVEYADMNLNDQIDWSDTDRIVSNDTRYVALNGDWWRFGRD